MKSLLQKICWGRVLGVYLSEGRATLTLVVSTPAGTKVVSCCEQAVGEDGPGPGLEKWLQSSLTPRQRRRIPVSVGLGAERTFFTSRALQEVEDQAPAAETVLAACAAGTLEAAGAAIDYTRSKPAGAPIYSVAACRRQLAEEILQALRRSGVNHCRLELAPWAMLQTVPRHARPPRHWKSYVRVIVEEKGGLAILVSGGRPFLWRRFATVPGHEANSIAIAIRHLVVHVSQNLELPAVAGAVLQGQVDDALAQKVRDETCLEVVARPGENADNRSCSLAMAMSARVKDQDSLDLFKTLQPPPSLRQLFPAKLAMLLAVTAAGLGGFLWETLSEANRDSRRLQAQNASHAWARNLKTPEILQEKKVLEGEVTAVRAFLTPRVTWSNYLRDLPTRLPGNSCLTNITGAYEMQSISAKQQKRTARSLSISGMARFADRSSAPKEIDLLLESLRGVSLLQKDFPLVNLAEIKWKKDGYSDLALFTIVAMPKEKNVPTREEKPAEKGGH